MSGALRRSPFLVPLLVAATALARPGGGQSFHSGYHSGGGGYSDGGGGGGGLAFYLVLELIRLAFFHPVLGIPLLCFGTYVAYQWFKSNAAFSSDGWSSGAPEATRPRPSAGPSPRRQLEGLRKFDPAFSTVLFEDFLYALYAQTHEARGKGHLETLSPYLSPQARKELAGSAPAPREVKGIIVGGLQIRGVRLSEAEPEVGVSVQFESNYSEVAASGDELTYWAVERWSLTRRRDAVSRKPGNVSALACPSCGAPLNGIEAGRCSYCHKAVDTGDFDWLVTHVETLDKSARIPSLFADEGARPDDEPTRRDPLADQALTALLSRDPSLKWEGVQARLATVFQNLQVAWSTLQWEKARPFVTDSLFKAQSYWIEAYRRAGARNVTERARIERVELCRVTEDAYYDAITVRLRARGLDYTLGRDGKVVSGSRTQERPYSEYWTLIRGRGTSGPSSGAATCPKCGAPLKVSMAGDCEYCKAHLTSGEFDWVLSKIEQPETYEA